MTDPFIANELEAARRKLLDTGNRSRLIHVNRASARANCINIVNERADDIFRILRVQGKTMRFTPIGADGDETEPGLAPSLSDEAAMEARYTDSFLETPLGPEAQARRLLRMARDAKTAEEEQGLNILYLAIGFLRWKEKNPPQAWRESPLILLPARLIRTERGAFILRAAEDDLTTNLSLQERLKQDFGICIPDIDETEDFTPSTYFQQVRQTISGNSGWEIDENGMQLGFFSFAKLLMHRDLDVQLHPELTEHPLVAGLCRGFPETPPLVDDGAPLDAWLRCAQRVQIIDADASQTRIIEEVRRGANLVVQGPPGTGKSQTIANIIASAVHDGKTVLFVAEKMAALSVVFKRLSDAGLGPACLELHSRAANKKACLKELERTLGLAVKPPDESPFDFDTLQNACDRLNHIANLLHAPLPPTGETPFAALSELIGFLGNPCTAFSLPQEGLENLDREARQNAHAAIASFVEAIKKTGKPQEHPFFGVGNANLQPMEIVRLGAQLQETRDILLQLLEKARRMAQFGWPAPASFDDIEKLCTAIAFLAEALPETPAWVFRLFAHTRDNAFLHALQCGAAWEALQERAARFTNAAWSLPADPIEQAVERGRRSWFYRWFGGYRRACRELAGVLAGPLPDTPDERLQLVQELKTLQQKRAELEKHRPVLQKTLGENWEMESIAFSGTMAMCAWISRAQAMYGFSSAGQLASAFAAFSEPKEAANALGLAIQTAKTALLDLLGKLQFGPQLDGHFLARLNLPQLAENLKIMAENTHRYGEWAEYLRCMQAARLHQADAVVQKILENRLPPEHAADAFLLSCAEARWTAARMARPEIDAIAHEDRHRLTAQFRQLENQSFLAMRQRILHRHIVQLPRGAEGEMGIIRGEINRKRGHRPIRWLMANAGGMVQRIKPVFLMSPLSASQFLEPGKMRFDLLVMDEASQIRPEEALGVIARARQMVVVGDARQLPPTSFFDRLTDDADEENASDEADEAAPTPAAGAKITDMESILALCDARGLPSRMLQWHYRSRTPALMQVSNAQFYENKLVLPPSPLQNDPAYGMIFHKIDGVYHRGFGVRGARPQTNPAEARAIVEALSRHAREHATLSLGVVAFSKQQADMISEQLEIARRQDPVLNAFLQEGRFNEDAFVKNLENVQGDERDVIFISVGYGPDAPGGRLASMHFGPVNREGGERRLNVLFTRARLRCEIFCSFDPDDIDLNRTQMPGPRVLKRFLKFAKSGLTGMETPTTGDAGGSPFEASLASCIRAMGFDVDCRVGTPGFSIDIAVRHPQRPGQYLAAIAGDGTSSSAAWARERDRQRQDILESLGWRFCRVFGLDWYFRRSEEEARIREFLSRAVEEVQNGVPIRGANETGPAAPANTPPPDENESLPLEAIPLPQAAPYVKARVSAPPGFLEPHETPLEQLAKMVAVVVEQEGPIHRELTARRIAEAFSKGKTGSRIAAAVENAIAFARQRDWLLVDGDFLLSRQQAENPPVRSRRGEMDSGPALKAEYLPPMEIRAAARQITRENGSMPPDALVQSTARLLGFARLGSELKKTISEALQS